MARTPELCVIDAHQLAAIVRNCVDNTLIVDTRSFLEFNVSHIIGAINVGCAKLMKRRLQQEKIGIRDFLTHNCHLDVDEDYDIIVYDQSSQDARCLTPDSFLYVFLEKLLPVFNSVNILRGGFLDFQAAYPKLCQDEKGKFAPLTSLSQPCLPISNHGPTRILPFLYLGSQQDALNKEVLQDYNITYELNVTTSCPQPDFIQDSHFMRIPVNDNYSEKLLPYFPKAFQFLDKARESGGCVLVHCLAGISRSATVAIAYVMKHLKMSSDDAYRYVKSKRATISPNFNFLGQLLEFEQQLHSDKILSSAMEISTAPIISTLNSMPCGRFETGPNFRDRECKRNVTRNRRPSCCAEFISVNRCGSANQPVMKRAQIINKRHESFTFKETTTTSGSKGDFETDYTLHDGQWHEKGIPISCLNEISFTPCQTSVTNVCENPDSSEKYSYTESGIESTHFSTEFHSSTVTELRTAAADNVQMRRSKEFDFALFDSILSECKLETIKNFNSLSQDFHLRSDTPLSPNSDAHSSDLSGKEYSRSDSVSTSGLGSEGSDCADSWNDYHGSCERETDILMDDEYATVPSEDSEYQQRSAMGFGDSYEESLYAKYEIPDYKGAFARSPLSPSEKHFMDDFPCHLSEVQDEYNSGSGNLCREVPSKISEDAQDESCLVLQDHSRSSNKHLCKGDGLYRAHSCPGILSSESVSRTSSLDGLLNSGTPCFRRNKASNTERADKCRNRYSCSSLDYMDYTSHVIFTHDSCPDVAHFTASNQTSLSSSQRTYRHSMIEVS